SRTFRILAPKPPLPAAVSPRRRGSLGPETICKLRPPIAIVSKAAQVVPYALVASRHLNMDKCGRRNPDLHSTRHHYPVFPRSSVSLQQIRARSQKDDG